MSMCRSWRLAGAQAQCLRHLVVRQCLLLACSAVATAWELPAQVVAAAPGLLPTLLLQWHDGFLPKYMPMIIPPIPWSGIYQGGYLTHSTCIMRARGSHLQIDLLKQADRTGRLNRVSICCCETHQLCGLKLGHMAANA